MKNFKNILYILPVMLLFLASCEKVIDIELDDSDRLVVVDGMVTDVKGYNYVILTRSADYFDNEIEVISNVNINVFDDKGNTFNFIEFEPGIYIDTVMVGVPGNTYYFKATIDGELITASSKMPQRVEIDSLTYEESEFGFGDEVEYTVSTNFSEPAGVENYYRVRTYINGFEEKGFSVVDDKFIDGNYIQLPNFTGEVYAFDTVNIYLHSIDEANFDFYSIADLNVGGGSDNAAPGNPIFNIKGEKAIGNFGAQSVSSGYVVVIP